MIARFLLVCLGGAVGTAARYATALAAASAFGTAFPFGTLLVNVTGSFLIAFLMQVGTATELLSPDLRVILTTGVMGGFTTYSSFNYESTALFRQGAWALGALNMSATVIGCLIAGLAGLASARLLFGR
jgi:fluoride exporter